MRPTRPNLFVSALALVVGFSASSQAFAQHPKSFNPKISLILQSTYANYSEKETEIGGLLLGPETELRPEGFSISETELAFEANVDDLFRGWSTIAIHEEEGETEVELEEIYGETLSLPGGTAIKFGRFFSEIGYQNRQHVHAWEFVDAPLVYRTLLANQLGIDGAQLRWVAPTDLFLQLGVELGNGNNFPAGGEDLGDIGQTTAFAKVGGDFNRSNSWRFGASFITSEANERVSADDHGGGNEEYRFTGDSDLVVLDFIWKWAPNGNPKQRNFVFQTEVFLRDEEGNVDFIDNANAANNASTAYSGDVTGFYVQGVYQFVPRWRAGLRYGSLSVDNTVANDASGLEHLTETDEDPSRLSVMVDYSHSEFSRIRAQFNRDESDAEGKTDNQFLLQYILSLGAHPAHQF